MKERLDKFLSEAGVCARSEVPYLIRTGRVFVNKKEACSKSQKIDLSIDLIEVDGKKIEEQKHIYLMMNKCKNYVCSNKDGVHETVFSLLDSSLRTAYFIEHLHLVGRLDIDTEGLLLFTTDGALTHKLISPKSECEKTYFVRLKNRVLESEQVEYIEKFASGIFIRAEANEREHFCKSAKLVWKSFDECELTISEGKYHQVKRMFLSLGNEVVYLKRISIGSLQLDPNLLLGQYRELTQDELERLIASC